MDQTPPKVQISYEEEDKQQPLEWARNLKFVNSADTAFKLDPNPSNNVPKPVSKKDFYFCQVRGFVFSKVTPTALDNPRIGALSETALDLIGVNAKEILASETYK